MDRRNFLKKSFAASIFGALAFKIELCNGFCANESKNEPLRSLKTGDFTAATMVYGGGLFNGYARNRDSIDGAGLRLRLPQTGFLAGRQTGNCPGTQYFC
jgi:hypothetical protein